VTILAAAAVGLGFAIAALLIVPAARRTGLGIWHPAIAWLGLEAVFFGVGAAILVTQGRDGPACYVAASVVAFGVAVAVSDRLARLRAGATSTPPTPQPTMTELAEGLRWTAVLAMIAAGVAVLVPTLMMVGIPALTSDVTGARSAIGGIDVQVVRVALPAALVVAVLIASTGDSAEPRLLAVGGVILAVVAEIALASRYLAVELAATLVIGLALAGRPLAGRLLAAAVIVGAMLFIVVGVLRAYGQAGENPVAFAVDRSINRILLIEPRTLDAIQTVIPSEVPYFGGLTWIRRLAPLLGRDDVPNLGYWIYPRLFPDQTVPGYAAPGILGEAWANFGPFGIVVPAALGVLTERLAAAVSGRRRSGADIAAAALAILFLARTHAVGLTGLAVLAVLVVAWRLLAAPVPGLRSDLVRTLRWQT